MPSLRKLVKITEWEKVRVSTVKFAQHAMLDPELQPRVTRRGKTLRRKSAARFPDQEKGPGIPAFLGFQCPSPPENPVADRFP